MKWKYWITITFSFVVSLGALARDPNLAGLRPPGGGSLEPVSVVLDLEKPLGDQLYVGLEQELRRIFFGTATPILLVTPDLNTHPQFSNEILMTRIRGNCRVDAMPPLHFHKADTLGRTMVTDGRILPYIELDCRQISGAVKQQLLGKSPADRNRLLGRAMARVLAHEIYHVMAQTHRHGPHGVAAESMTGDDLVKDRLDFRFEEFEEMGLVPVMATH